jgi:hypothetical protein
MLTIQIPLSLVEEAIACHHIQMKWSLASVELRSREVERMEHHFSEILMAIIIREYQNQKRLK